MENKEKEVKKLSYEELENISHQLSEQSRQLHQHNQKMQKLLEEANLSNFFKRLDYLWTIINSNTTYLSEEFKIKCAKEFEGMMSSPEEEAPEDK